LGCPFFHGLPSFLLNVHFLPVGLLLNSILYVAVIVFVFYLIRLISSLTLAFYFLIYQVSALTPVFLAFSPLLFFLFSLFFFLLLNCSIFCFLSCFSCIFSVAVFSSFVILFFAST